MTGIPVEIYAGHHSVAVNEHGELIVGAISPNESRHHNMTLVNTAYNFAIPVMGKKMRLQNILLYANKGVGVNDASVVIYTADSPTSLTPIETVMEVEIPKYGSRDLIDLNLQLPSGVYLNAKTDDATIFATMMGYYIATGSDSGACD